jgi:hypothetical protein
LLVPAGAEEALMEASERGVVAGGDQSAHEEGDAHLRPPAADEAFAFPLSGLTRPGREPDEGGDFAPVEPAEFEQFGDQGAGDGRPDVGPSPATAQDIMPESATTAALSAVETFVESYNLGEGLWALRAGHQFAFEGDASLLPVVNGR